MPNREICGQFHFSEEPSDHCNFSCICGNQPLHDGKHICAFTGCEESWTEEEN